MNKEISIKLLHKIRYLFVLPFILVIGLVTLPLTLFFDWNGIWILCIAHEEWCSLSEAKRMFLKNQNIRCGQSHCVDNINSSYSFSEDQSDIVNNYFTGSLSSDFDTSQDDLFNPAFNHRILICNIFHSSTYDQ